MTNQSQLDGILAQVQTFPQVRGRESHQASIPSSRSAQLLLLHHRICSG
ncbi:hypothetical protein FOXYSP1_15377 [Fusarium oxysporum f. sp. phaseoli]